MGGEPWRVERKVSVRGIVEGRDEASLSSSGLLKFALDFCSRLGRLAISYYLLFCAWILDLHAWAIKDLV